MKTLKQANIEFGKVREWELSKGPYIATGDYCNQIKEDVELFKCECEQFIEKHTIDTNFENKFKLMFPNGKISLEKNPRGICYRLTYNEACRNVMEKLQVNNLLIIFDKSGKWNPSLDLEKII